jgi:phosphohistidine phosphatase SixA
VRLYVVRHSKPEPQEGKTDLNYPQFDPGLTDEGEDMVKALAAWMVDKDEVPNIILASPALRTQQTAQLLVEEAGIPSDVKIVDSIGPHMSIRACVLATAQDQSQTRVCIVSHHESISFGLRELNGDPWPHMDQYAQAELRIYRVKRKSGKWDEHRRMLPSDLGMLDYY